MPDPIKVPLSTFQQARLAAFQQDAAALQARLNDTITAIVAGVTDPSSVQGWEIRQVGAEIVCTPPAQKPQLVPDIGPSGASEAAATG